MKELKDISRENPFKVPENYFEELNGRIMSGVEDTPARASVTPYRSRLWPIIAAAASLAVLVLIGITVTKSNRVRSSENISPEISFNTIQETELYNIDISTLEEKVSEKGTLGDINDISRNEIIDYLVSENISILDIYEQL